MARPWNNWYHCMGHTYGSWLRGDSRGWRARHHREHVDGDYMNPPATGMYDELYEKSRRLMKRPEVVLPWALRIVAMTALVEALRHYRAEVIDAVVTANHFHLLARFTPLDGSFNTPATGVAGLCGDHHLKDGRNPVPRYLLGKALSWSSRAVRLALQSPGTPVPGWAHIDGGIWASRPKCDPIRNRAHQIRTTAYIRAHQREGGAVYSLIGRAVDSR